MVKQISTSLLVLAVGGALTLIGSAVAQTSTPASQPAGPGVYDPGHPRVNQVDKRLENQKNRIQQGVKSGTLNKQEANQLQRHDQRIARQEKRDMTAHGGHLTKQEQGQINRELNRNSKQISKEKHGQ